MNSEGSFLLDEVAQVRNLTTHLRLVPRLGMSGTAPLFPHTRSWLAQMLIRLRFFISSIRMPSVLSHIFRYYALPTAWCVQVLKSPKEAFAAAMQSWRERCEKCVCLQGDYVEK